MAQRKRLESAAVQLSDIGKVPDEKTVNEAFQNIIGQLSLKPEQLADMTTEKKWYLVKQYEVRSEEASAKGAKHTPHDAVKSLEKGKEKRKTLEDVRVLLTNQPVDWVSQFIALGGDQKIFDMFIATAAKKMNDKDRELLAECTRAMKALMNVTEGFDRVLAWTDSMRYMMQSLDHINNVDQAQVLLVLAAVCLVSTEGHNRLLAEVRRDNRMLKLMDVFRQKDPDLKKATLTFLNALIGAITDTETRVIVRNDFIKMNIKDYLKRLAAVNPDGELMTQIKIFEDGIEADRGNYVAAGHDQKEWEEAHRQIEELKEKLEKLQTQYNSLEFEKRNSDEEVEKLRRQLADIKAGAVPAAGSTVASPAPTTTSDAGSPPPPPPPPGGASVEPATSDAGAAPPPPPPPPGAEGAPPPPPPPPGSGDAPPPPPPPPGGGPPPPPPPPGAGGVPPPPGMAKAGRPPKPKRKPNKKMRAWNWNKIPDNKIDNTIWEKIDDTKFRIETSEFEELFGEKEREEAPKAANSAGGSANKAPEKKQKIQLLDPKKGNNCEIMLRGLKMEPADIKKALLNLDEKVLPEEVLRAMKDFIPQPEEIQILKEFTGNKADLGNAEKYYMEMMTVPGLAARINSMLFKASFVEKSDVVKKEINIVLKAIECIKDNKKLMQLLEIILALGNYMNGQSNRGGCYGVRISSLPKMVDVKSSNGKINLMHYLMDLLEKRHKELLTVIDDLSPTHDAAKLNIREIMSKVTELQTGMKALEAQLNDPNVDAKLKEVMGAFAAKAKETVSAIENRASKIDPTFKELLAYFGEPPSTECEDFFGTFSAFAQAMEKAKNENIKRAELARQEEKARALQAELKNKQSGPQKQKGQIDDAIAELRSGRALRRLSIRLDPQTTFIKK